MISPPEQLPTEPQGRPRRRKFNLQRVVPYALLLLLIVALAATQPSLIKLSWIERKTDSTMTLVFVIIGQTLVILTGGIDLSVGGVISVSNSLAATHFGSGGPEMLLWTAIILSFGTLAGLVNGYIVARLRVQPFIATLATWSIWGGLALAILPTDGGSVPDSLFKAATGNIAGIPKSILALLLIVILWLIFRRTRLATQIFAIGSSEKAAYLSGASVVRVKMIVYAMSGFFAALAGINRTIQLTSGSPVAGNPFILSSVAAVVIGGAALSGGRGGALGGIAGAFILTLISDLIFFLGISSYYSVIFQGLLLIASVTLYSIAALIQRRRRAA